MERRDRTRRRALRLVRLSALPRRALVAALSTFALANANGRLLAIASASKSALTVRRAVDRGVVADVRSTDGIDHFVSMFGEVINVDAAFR